LSCAFWACVNRLNMVLEKNIAAPVFKLKDVYGRVIDLDQYKTKRVLLGFFRHAGCPFCNLRVHTLTRVHEELKSKGLEMIFFFESREQVILRSSFHQGVSPIPIISDPEKIWYKTYGLEPSTLKSVASHFTTFIQTAVRAKIAGVPVHMMAAGESFSTMPAEFLIDKDLVVKKIHYSERLNHRLDIADIRNFAESGKVSD
jgi:thioredoxin-dependent peroxiredoxin